ncbi:MAG: hypothetical protein NVV73_22965 [Cellvibrionaceae bacterium]|nr:hypothetical protein [Cellvibrionaceae bacterium]
MTCKNAARTLSALCLLMLLAGCGGDTELPRNTSSDLAIVLTLLAATVVMFALNRPRMDAVALIMMAALPLTGIISVGESPRRFERSEYSADRNPVCPRRRAGAHRRRPAPRRSGDPLRGA